MSYTYQFNLLQNVQAIYNPFFSIELYPYRLMGW